MSLDIFLDTQCGFRGVSTVSKHLAANFNLQSVSFSCVRQWVLRLGYGILHQDVERRDDWIYIVDFSISLGTQKCLLILGVSMESVLTSGYALKHEQMTVLDIFVGTHFDGNAVFNRLTGVAEKTGVPYQIIADGGNDLKKGIELFCEENQQVLSTYDVSHLIGVCLKKGLAKQAQWLELQDDLGALTQQVKQSDVSFLRPIALSKKARWMNIKNELTWLENIYEYEEKNDFHLIATGFRINNVEEVFEKNKHHCVNKYAQKRLKKALKDTIFANQQAFECFLQENNISSQDKIECLDAGKTRFAEKFSILDKHKSYFSDLQELNEITENIKLIIKGNGLSPLSLTTIELAFEKISNSWVKDIIGDIKDRLNIEYAKAQTPTKPLLCCSDIIESVFGKFKMKSNQTVGGIYATVLNMALFCTNLTTKVITEILTKTKMTNVEQWFENMAGISNLAKRKNAFT